MSKPSYQRAGEIAFGKIEKINSELFTLTYGAIVTQLIKDYEDLDEVNKQLDKMGYNIGVRLVEEFLAKSNVGRCADFKETAEVISKVAFKMFLGVTAQVSDWNQDNTEFSLIITENPMTDFVELPEHCEKKLSYANLLCGVIRGALEMVQMRVECKFLRDILHNDDVSEIRVTLKELMADEFPGGDD